MAALRKFALGLLCLMVGYHGYATASVTCHMLKDRMHATTDDCPEMSDGSSASNEYTAGDDAAGGDGRCCGSKLQCCAKFIVPFAPLPAVPHFEAPTAPPQDWGTLGTSFSSYIPPVLDPPPRA